MNSQTRPAVVLASNRIPFARSNGPYAKASNQDMLTAALDGLIDRAGIAGERLGEIAGGAVLKHSRDFNLTRESLLGTRISPETPAYDVGQACGTGLETFILTANKVALGQIDSAIACGVDTTSDAPIALNEDLRKILMEANSTSSNADRAKLLARLRPGMIVPEIPQNAEPRTGLSMGEHTAIMARDWGITREAQDELTIASHDRLAAAYDEGFEDDLVTPYLGLERDQNLRPGSTLEKLGKLKPVFGGPEGTMTAANSTPLSDGASAVLLASLRASKGRTGLAKVLVPEPRRSALDKYLDRYRRADKTRNLQRTRRFDAVRKDGKSIQIELSVSRADLPMHGTPYFVGIVRDEKRGPTREEARREFLEAVPRDRVERCERLVHQHDRPFLHERAGERHALALPAGKRRGPAVRPVGQAHLDEKSLGTEAHRRVTDPSEAESKQHVVDDREPGQEKVLLCHIGDAAGEGYAVAARDRARGAGRRETREHPKETRLADTARTEKAGALAALECHVEAVEQQDACMGQAPAAESDGEGAQ